MFVGDVMLARRLEPLLQARGAGTCFESVAPLLDPADIVFGNLESAVHSGGAAHPQKLYNFAMAPQHLSGLRAAGFDVLSLANNHLLDFGPEAIPRTRAALKELGIECAGAGSSEAEARRPAYVEAQGLTVAFLCYCSIMYRGIYDVTIEARGPRPGVARVTVNSLRHDIAAARERADIVVASIHSGKEFAQYPGEVQRKWAHAAIRAGADLVVMHHPHVLQGFELCDGGLIAYSLGDFVFDKSEYDTLPSAILAVELAPAGSGAKLVSAEAIPLFIESYVPRIPTGATRAAILSHLDLLSAPYGTRVLDDGTRGHIVSAANARVPVSTRHTETAGVVGRPNGARQTHALAVPDEIGVLRGVALDLPEPAEPLHGRLVLQARTGRNCLLFSDFESEQPSLWDVQRGWKKFDKSRSRSGAQSLRLRRHVGDARRAIAAQRTTDYGDLPRDQIVSRQESRARLRDGRTYLARGYVSGDDVRTAGLEVRWYERWYVNEYHPVVRVDRIASSPGDGKWLLCEAWLTRPQSADWATIWCSYRGVPFIQHWPTAALAAVAWALTGLLAWFQIDRHYDRLARKWPGKRALRLRGAPSRRSIFLQVVAILGCLFLAIFFASARSYVWFDDVELIEWGPWQTVDSSSEAAEGDPDRHQMRFSPADPGSRADYVQLRVAPLGHSARPALTPGTLPHRLTVTWEGEGQGPAPPGRSLD